MSFPVPVSPATNTTTGTLAELFVRVGAAPANPTHRIPELNEFDFTVNGETISTSTYGSNPWSRTDKTGLNASLSFSTLAFGNNSVVAPLITAANTTGGGAKALFVVKLPDGAYFHGQIVIVSVSPAIPKNGAFEYRFTCTADGTVTYQAPA